MKPKHVLISAVLTVLLGMVAVNAPPSGYVAAGFPGGWHPCLSLSGGTLTDDLTIEGVLTSDSLVINSTDRSNYLALSHDNANALFGTDDGIFIFQTDEGTNTQTRFDIRSKGTGNAELRVVQTGHSGTIMLRADAGGIGSLFLTGTTKTLLKIQPDPTKSGGGVIPIAMFGSSIEGETSELKISGFKTSDALRTLEIGVGVDAANTASFDGVDNYLFDGNVQINGVTVKQGLTEQFTSEEVADDAEIVIATGTVGFGFAQIGDNQEYAQFSWKADGTVTLINNSANAVAANTDDKFCIYDAGSGIAIKNRLGSALDVRFQLHYSS